jgi:hydroxymethylpyrimidine pyrophosphatase-like HAD family hydrolase
VSADFALLVHCETELQNALGDQAHVVRSQNYYLDITPPGFDKGTFVDAMSRHLAIPPQQIATIGDMSNDVPMFRKSGLSFAMGNASDAVKAEASHVTTSNEDDGFAKAMAQIVKTKD